MLVIELTFRNEANEGRLKTNDRHVFLLCLKYEAA